jgi:hypothetical protein
MKNILILFFFIICTSAMAQVKHIVFDLDGTLVQGIPFRAAKNVTGTEVFTINTDRRYSYVKRPHAEEVIRKLTQQNQIILHIASDLPKDRTNALLNGFTVNGTPLSTIIKNNLGKIIYSNDIKLRQVSSDTNNVIYITSKPGNNCKPAKQKVFLGQGQYYFNTFAEAQAERTRLTGESALDAHDIYIPKTQSEFDKEYYKLSSVYYSILSSLRSPNFYGSFDGYLKSKTIVKNSKIFAENNHSLEFYKLANGKCSTTNVISKKVISRTLNDCIESMRIPLQWHKNSCAYKDSEHGIVKTLQMNECVEKLPVVYYWKGKTQNNCFAYADGEFKIQVNPNNCNQTHAIYDTVAKTYHFIDHFVGMEGLSSTSIIKEYLDYNASFSLDGHNKASKKISGTQFPRTGHYLWRAMEPNQFGLYKGVRALLGDNSANVESKYFTDIKLKLMDKKSPFGYNIPNQIKSDFKALESKIPMSETEAAKNTEKLMDKYFSSLNNSTIDRLINYRSGNGYIDWPATVVFSSIAPGVCQFYGKRILVSFKEKKVRSIDLNYYNYVVNSIWSDYAADTGEFLTPSHIEADEVMGVFRTTPGYTDNNTTFTMLKVEVNGEKNILGLNKIGEFCYMVNDKDLQIKTCNTPSNYTRVSNTERPARPTSSTVNPEFIIKLCPMNATCSLSEAAKGLYNLQNGNPLGDDFIDKLKNMKIRGLTPKVFYNKKNIPAGKMTN